jgi:hypothetical protein
VNARLDYLMFEAIIPLLMKFKDNLVKENKIKSFTHSVKNR